MHLFSIISGVDTQVDVHGPNTGGACPRETSQTKAEKDGAQEPRKTETNNEYVIPVKVEKDAAQEAKSEVKQEAAKEKQHFIPIKVEQDTKQEEKVDTNPYASVIQAMAAVQVAEAARAAHNAVPFDTAAAVAQAAEEATKAASQGSGQSERSPSPHSDGWTLVDEDKKDAQQDLGARPKTPPQPFTAPLHPGNLNLKTFT